MFKEIKEVPEDLKSFSCKCRKSYWIPFAEVDDENSIKLTCNNCDREYYFFTKYPVNFIDEEKSKFKNSKFIQRYRYFRKRNNPFQRKK